MYEITIRETRDVTKVRSKHALVADTGNEQDGGRVYKWQDVETTEQESGEIYSQKVTYLNLENVIKAVNGMESSNE